MLSVFAYVAEIKETRRDVNGLRVLCRSGSTPAASTTHLINSVAYGIVLESNTISATILGIA